MNLLLICVLTALSASGIYAVSKRQAQFPNLNNMINQAAGNIFQRVTSNINNTFNPFNFAPMTAMQPANATHAQVRSLDDSISNSTNITVSVANPLTTNETSSTNTSLSLIVDPGNGSGQNNHSLVSATLSRSVENVTAQNVLQSSTTTSENTTAAGNGTIEKATPSSGPENVTEDAGAISQTTTPVGSDATTEAETTEVTTLQTILLNITQSVSETDVVTAATTSAVLSSNATDSLSSNVSSTGATPVDSTLENKDVTGNVTLSIPVPEVNATSPVVVSNATESSVSVVNVTDGSSSSFPQSADTTTIGENETAGLEHLATTTEVVSSIIADNMTTTDHEVENMIGNVTQDISSTVSTLAENLLSNTTTVADMPQLLNTSAVDQANLSLSTTATNVTELTSATASTPIANITEQGSSMDATATEVSTTETAETAETTTTEEPVTTEEPAVIVAQPTVNETKNNLESITSEDETSGYGIIRHSTTDSSTGVTILSSANVTQGAGDGTPSNVTEATTIQSTQPAVESSTPSNGTQTVTNASLVAALTEEVKHMNLSSASPDDLNTTEVLGPSTTAESVTSVTQSNQHSVQPASPTTLVWTLPEFQGEADSHFPSRTMLVLNAKNGWKEKNQKLIDQFKPQQIIRLNETNIVTVTSPPVEIPEESVSETTSDVQPAATINKEPPKVAPFGKPKYIPKDPQDEEKFWSIMRSAAKATRGKASFPTLKEIPSTTSFSCNDVGQPGFYADKETDCQVFYRCDIYGGQFRFICPEQTLFSQLTLVCDHWYNVNCQEQVKHADYINSRAYDFKRFGRYLERGSQSRGNELEPKTGVVLERESQSTGNDLQPKKLVIFSQLVTGNNEVTNITDKNNPLTNHLDPRSGNVTSGNVTDPTPSTTTSSPPGNITSGNVTRPISSLTTTSTESSPVKMLTFT